MTSPMTEAALQRQILEVEWMGPSLNSVYAGVHWRKRKTWAEDGHLAVMAAVRQARIKPVIFPVHLTFTPYIKGRQYDVSNYALTAKIIEDGLVKEGILKADTPRYVRSMTIKAPVKTTEQSSMILIIEKA